MQRHRLAAFALLPAAIVLFSIGCGGTTDPAKPPGPSTGPTTSSDDKKASTPGGSGKGKEELASTGWGTLKGKVTLVGDKPKVEDLKPEMEKQKDKDRCLMGDTRGQSWKVGDDKGVANVVVWLRAPQGKYFKVPDGQKDRNDTVKIDQPFCVFEPHVVVLNPSVYDAASKKQKPTGQKFVIANSATIQHNSNWTPSDATVFTGANKTLDPKSEQPVEVKSGRDNSLGGEQTLTVVCNVHPWMRAYGKIFDHPFAAVSSGDEKDAKEFGNYEIKQAPAGAEVELVYWHESMQKPVVLKKVTLKEGENTENIELKP